jgi:hypothetical protein
MRQATITLLGILSSACGENASGVLTDGGRSEVKRDAGSGGQASNDAGVAVEVVDAGGSDAAVEVVDAGGSDAAVDAGSVATPEPTCTVGGSDCLEMLEQVCKGSCEKLVAAPCSWQTPFDECYALCVGTPAMYSPKCTQPWIDLRGCMAVHEAICGPQQQPSADEKFCGDEWQAFRPCI